MNSIQTIQTNPAMQAALGGSSGVPTGGDAFAMLLQQLLGGGMGAADLLLNEGGLFGQQQEEEPTTEAMEMMAAMFASNPFALGNFVLDGQTLQADQSALQAGMVTDSPAVLFEAAQPEAQQPAETAAEGAFQSALQRKQDASQVTVLEQHEEAEEGTQALKNLSQFRSSVMEAQKLLKTNKQEKTIQEPVDVDALQRDVNSGKFNNVSTVTQSKELPEPAEVLAQVKTGIMQNFARGKDEFVVKLKPEGLGEITVKLAQNDGKISLSLITSTAHTAKLLSGELDALRESLRPLGADVREIVQQNQHAAAGQSFNQAFADQRSSHFAQQHQQQQRSYTYREEEFDALLSRQPETLKPTSGLDAYI